MPTFWRPFAMVKCTDIGFILRASRSRVRALLRPLRTIQTLHEKVDRQASFRPGVRAGPGVARVRPSVSVSYPTAEALPGAGGVVDLQ
jgi:hypothetical protein